MSDDQKLYPWNEGLPTKPDVDLLLKTWPDPKVGDRFDYESVVALLHIEQADTRFRTITAQWRKRLLERGVVIECEAGRAFYVASIDEVLSRTYGTLRWVGRKLRKHRRKLSVQTPVSDAQRDRLEHDGRIVNALERETKKARMNPLPSTKAPEMPQIAPPEKKSG